MDATTVISPGRARASGSGSIKERAQAILAELEALADPNAVEGMARYGINPKDTLGVSMPKLRALAKEADRDHGLALDLWASGIHEARILAALVDEPRLVDEAQMEHWVTGFDSWDVCDQVCGNLFDKTPFAFDKALAWAARDEEFVKRAGFALMAWLAVHDKHSSNDRFIPFLAAVVRGADDERNYVKKAVNWALRQIGKRNAVLNEAAVIAAREVQRLDSRAARWVAGNALKELTGEAVQKRF